MSSENIFMQKRQHAEFSWENLGDIKGGRGDLGEEMPVLVYRLMQYTMLDVLCKAHGLETANDFFREAGYLAGFEFAKNMLDLEQNFSSFVVELQEALKNLRIGVLRIEAFDPETYDIVLTVGQDLDCSGLPITNENVCVYDEGFIAGILEAYTGVRYEVREIDCWASGDRVCRFKGVAILTQVDSTPADVEKIYKVPGGDTPDGGGSGGGGSIPENRPVSKIILSYA